MLFFLISLGLLGLAAGSFLSVVIQRLGTGRTILWGRSHCPHCGKQLNWFELLPVLSFFMQGGQCGFCRRAISWFYPAVEVISAGLFMVLGWAALEGILPLPPFLAPDSGPETAGIWNGMVFTLVYYIFFAAIGLAVSFFDFQRRLIPYVLVWPLAAVGLSAQILGAIRAASFTPLIISFAAAAGAFLFFWSIWFFSQGRAMGRGDADAALAIMLYLGPTVGFWGMVMAFWLGALFGLLLVIAGRLGWKNQLPLAPFLFSGAVIALFLAKNFNLTYFFPYVF